MLTKSRDERPLSVSWKVLGLFCTNKVHISTVWTLLAKRRRAPGENFGLPLRIIYTKQNVTTGSTLPWVLVPLSRAHASSTPDGSTPCRSPAIIIRYIDTCVPPRVVLSFIHDHVFIHQSVSKFGPSSPRARPAGPPFPLDLYPCARSAICIREILSFRSVDGFFRGYDGRTRPSSYYSKV